MSWKGVAIAGIWIGTGISAKWCGVCVVFVAICAAIATSEIAGAEAEKLLHQRGEGK